MPDVVTIAGSPSVSSKSSALLEYTRQALGAQGLTSSAINVRNLPSDDLIFARFDSPAIGDCIARIQDAQAIVIASPVYKAAYSGVLKVFLDLLPQDALADKAVLPILTGGSPAHLLAIDYALKPVLAALGAQYLLRGVYALDTQVQRVNDEVLLDTNLAQRLQLALSELNNYLLIRTARFV